MTETAPLFSFVIPTRGGQQLGATLNSLQRAGVERYIEAVVVFDGQGLKWDEKLLHRCGAGIPLRTLEQPHTGPACARNRGAALAAGRWIVFLDDDCPLDAGFLPAMEAALETNPSIAAGGTPRLPESTSVWSMASHVVTESFLESQSVDGCGIRFLPSQNFALRRDAWLASSGFDESFSAAAGEDREFCLRWLAAGGSLVRVPSATFVHDHPLTLAGFVRKHREYGAAAARLGKRGQSAPVRFLRALAANLMRVRPFRRLPVVALAVVLSQFAAIGGAVLGGPPERS